MSETQKSVARSEADLLALENAWCSHGDTVHYTDPPKMFERCSGSFIYDTQGREYLDLQMWYSAVNFGYANRAPQHRAEEPDRTGCRRSLRSISIGRRSNLRPLSARTRNAKFGLKGRVHFNVGGSQAVEDSLKLVRNASNGKSLMFAFEGGYHGRTLGASAITSSYRYRRRYGHFGERAQFIPFPYCFRCPYGKSSDSCGLYCVDQFARLFDTEYYGVWDAKVGISEYAAFYIEPIQGTGGYVVPPPGYFRETVGHPERTQDPARR